METRIHVAERAPECRLLATFSRICDARGVSGLLPRGDMAVTFEP